METATQTMMVKSISKNTSPLCFLPNGRLLCYRCGKILLKENVGTVVEVRLFRSLKERWLSRFSYLNRFLRTGVRAAIAIDDNTVLLNIGCTVFELSVNHLTLSQGWQCDNNVRPLIFTHVEGITGFKDGVYFGGYMGNMTKKLVNVYHRTGVDQWEVVYTFPQGTINHVHNIVTDPYRQCLWIFTGDFDEASAIWKVTNNFKTVERVVCNDQKYRGCVVFALPEGLLYATDAPFAEDYIYLFNPDTFEVKEQFAIDGSCIYGCKWNDNFVFSSTVEGDGRNTSKMEFLFGRKRGAGIKNDYVHMYMGNLKDGFREIYKEKKDSMPYYTFQFGVFKFPYGANNTDTLYFQPVATKKNDLSLMKYVEDK